jgi:hypothetical protein
MKSVLRIEQIRITRFGAYWHIRGVCFHALARKIILQLCKRCHNRLQDDSCYYGKALRQSVNPLEYTLDPIKYEH